MLFDFLFRKKNFQEINDSDVHSLKNTRNAEQLTHITNSFNGTRYHQYQDYNRRVPLNNDYLPHDYKFHYSDGTFGYSK